jgi:phage shock protein PspC (stress-responsive transcriptional regulator)
MVAGVCGGLGELTGVDPLIFRVVIAVATIMGGAGLVAYAIAWLVIPEADDRPSHAESILHGRNLPRIGLVGIGILALIIAGGLRGWGWGHDWGGGGFGLVVLVGIGLWFLLRHESGVRPPVPPRPAAPIPPARPLVADAGAEDTTVTAVTEPVPPVPPPPIWPPVPPVPPPPRRPRERSKLFPITFFAALIVTGLLLLTDVGAATILASCLLVVGAGLLVGSTYGRRRGLIFLGILLTIATATATAADVSFDGGTGDRTWHPTSVAELQSTYRLGIGEGELDLRDVDLHGATRTVKLRIGAGALRIYVPVDASVRVRSHVGFGRLDVLGIADDGVDVDRNVVDRTGTDGTFVIDARASFGKVEVFR